MTELLSGKKILVTGACGTIGRELVSQLLSGKYGLVDEIRCIDNNESELFFLEQDFGHDKRASFYVSDISNFKSINNLMGGVQVVFHAAAMKHVILSERSPDQALSTNILGVQNIIEAAKQNFVERVVFTSSDKAVNPTNVMGATKLLGERLFTAAHFGGGSETIFHSTRFGNVLGSNGSVVQIFKRQINSNKPITITSDDMTRFVMGIPEAVSLVIDSCSYAKGGEVFITKMPSIRIIDLAKAMIVSLKSNYSSSPDDYKINYIGVKPGEKLYEELMNTEETRRAYEVGDYFVVLPALSGFGDSIAYDYVDESQRVCKPYISSEEQQLSVNEIAALLSEYNLV